MDGQSAEFHGLRHGKIDHVKALLEADPAPDLNVRDDEGETVLTLAAQLSNDTDHKDELIKTLIGRGADVNVQNNKGMTPLMCLAGSHVGPHKYKYRCVEYLLKAGADVNAQDSEGKTALMYASIKGNPAVIKVLLRAGANINAKGSGNKTAYQFVLDSWSTKNEFDSKEQIRFLCAMTILKDKLGYQKWMRHAGIAGLLGAVLVGFGVAALVSSFSFLPFSVPTKVAVTCVVVGVLTVGVALLGLVKARQAIKKLLMDQPSQGKAQQVRRVHQSVTPPQSAHIAGFSASPVPVSPSDKVSADKLAIDEDFSV